MAQHRESENPSHDLRLVKQAFVRHWIVGVAAVTLSVAAAAIYTALLTPLYSGRASILIENRTPAIIQNSGYETTESAVLSREVTEAQRVLAQTRPVLEHAAEIAGTNRADGSPRGTVKRRQASVDSQLLVLSVSLENPEDAADLANAWSDAFVEEMGRKEQSATMYARDFLEKQIPALRESWIKKETELQDFQVESKFDPTQLETHPARLRYAQLSQKLTDAGARAALLMNQVRACENAKATPNVLSQIPRVREDPTVAGYAKLIQDQRMHLAELRNDYDASSPVVAKGERRLKELQELIRQPLQDVLDAIKAELLAAQDDAKELAGLEEKARQEFEGLKSTAAKQQLMAFEAELARKQYEELAGRQQTAQLAGQIDYSYARPWERAEISTRPSWPNWPRNLLTGLAVGLALACGLIYLLEILDDTVRSASQLQTSLGVNVLGTAPLLERRLAEHCYTLAQEHPNVSPVESLRSLRTSLALNCNGDGTGDRGAVVLITSAGASEGKSFVALNLATLLASAEKRVLLVDGDLYKRTASNVHNMLGGASLADVRSGPQKLSALVRSTATPGLSILPVSKPVENPQGILDSPHFAALLEDARKEYDLVLIDSPPLLIVSAASVLAEKCDAVVVVTRSRQTRLNQVQHSIEALRRVKAKHSMYVINAVDAADASTYGYGYGYGYGYRYGYGHDAKDKKQDENAA